MNEFVKRLTALRQKMEQQNISVYLIPTADFHESEYVSDYFKCREYMTGFTGSAGTAVVTIDQAGLWTDGRYFIQAERQLRGSGVKLYRMGTEGVPAVSDFVRKMLKPGTALGFDGRVVNAALGEVFLKIAEEKEAYICEDLDLVGEIWQERPAFPAHPAFVLETEFAGKTVREKLADVRQKMEKLGADVQLLSSLCEIAWMLNIRGGDIAHVPVVMSFLLLTGKQCIWYVQDAVLDPDLTAYLAAHEITSRPYDQIYEDLAQLTQGQTVLLEKEKVNVRLLRSIPEGVKILDVPNPQEHMKAVKNPVEISNIRKAHIRDGVAYVKFCFWLKTHIQKETITELSAAEYLLEKRKEQEHFLDVSFDTISAYGANAAMMHYAPDPQHPVILKPRGFLLVDSGGHYLEGSTDITRNIVLGPLSMEEKQMFTAVVRSNLNLANARFLYGCCGQNLDILARGPLWQLGIDYRCGTGHGNGYLLNVHEGPNAFRWRIGKKEYDNCVLEEGMITTDEPGVYVEGKYGIRIENELLCKKWVNNEYGQFMEFETITYAPVDLDGILPDEMTGTERGYLNQYHQMVYETLAPYLSEEEKTWLREATRPV